MCKACHIATHHSPSFAGILKPSDDLLFSEEHQLVTMEGLDGFGHTFSFFSSST